MTNPFLFLDYESAFEQWGDNYYDIMSAAKFPQLASLQVCESGFLISFVVLLAVGLNQS